MEQNPLNIDINSTLFAFCQRDLFDSSKMADTCGQLPVGARDWVMRNNNPAQPWHRLLPLLSYWLLIYSREEENEA